MSRQKATQAARQNLTGVGRENLTGVGRAAQRSAVAGWQELAEAFDTAADRTQDLAGDARSRVVELRKQAGKRGKQARKRADEARRRGLDAKDEAYRRSAAARAALAGKQAHTWRWVIVAAAAGVGAGAAVAQIGRKLIRSREQAQLEKIEKTVADSTAAENGVNGHPNATGTAGTGAMPQTDTQTDSTIATGKTSSTD